MGSVVAAYRRCSGWLSGHAGVTLTATWVLTLAAIVFSGPIAFGILMSEPDGQLMTVVNPYFIALMIFVIGVVLCAVASSVVAGVARWGGAWCVRLLVATMVFAAPIAVVWLYVIAVLARDSIR